MKGRVTKTGYKRNSPDVNNDYNIIPSNRISMAGVDFPVLGIDNLGNAEVMYPGGEYEFQGDYVTELPAFGSGGLTQWFAEEWVDVKTGKKCGRSGKDKKGRPYPACRPSKRVNKTTPKTTKEMSAKEKAKFKKSKTSKKRINYNHKRAQFGGGSGDVFQEVDTYIKSGQKIRPNWAQTPNAVTNYTFGKNLIDDESRFSLGLQGTDILDEIKYRADAIGSVGVGLGNRKGKGFRPAGENLRAGLRGQASWQGLPGNVIENMLGRGSGLDWRGSVEGEAGVSYANGALRPYMSVMPQTNVFLNDNLSLGIGYEMRGRYDKNFNQPLSGNTITGTRAPVSQRDAYSGMGRGSGRLSLNYDLGNGDFIEGYYAKPSGFYQGSMPVIPQVMALESEGPRFGVRLRKSFKKGGSIPKAQEGIEVEPASRRIRYEDGRIKLQDPAIYDGMLDETTVTPYTQSELAFQEGRANQATGGLEPAYPIFDVMTLGLRTPATAGAKAIQAGIKKAPSKINPRYFQPNSNMYYRGIGREGMEDALESGLFRAKPSDKIPARMVDLGPNLGKLDMAKRFNKTYYSPRFNIADQYGAGYIAEVPKDAAKFSKRYKNTDWSMSTRDQIPVSEGRILEKNWWSGYKPIKAYGGSLAEYQAGKEVKGRMGVRPNPDGRESTHIMAREYVDGKGWVAFPTLFQNPDSSWVDMSEDTSWYPAYEEAIRRGEVYEFGDNLEAAIKFADEGSWKKEKYQMGSEVNTYTVKSGDTFYGIANRQGVNKEALVNANPNLNIDNLKVGETIQLPGISKNYALKEGKVVSMSPELYEKTPDFYKNPKLDKPDLQKDNTNLASFNNPRSKALLEAAKKVSEGQGGRPLEVLLNMSAWMESNLGLNPEAYNRTYTRGPMSIDDDAFNDVYNPRGDYGYTNTQKKGFEWLKGLGYEPAKMDSTLRADDPLAALATTRLIYGRATEPLPDPDNPRAVYDYYVNHYNKHGQDKYGTDEEHYARFLKGYNSLYNKKEEGGESLPSYDIYDNYNRAWLFARKKLGKDKLFKYGGRVCSTSTAKGL